jgi:threonine synthase
MHLKCSLKECGATLELHDRALACPVCGELLEVVVTGDYDPKQLKRTWLERRQSYAPQDASGVWRFRDFIPPYAADNVVTISEGNTPIIRGKKSAAWTSLRNLWFKHLGWNPTGCFKDLGMTVGMTEAKFVGAETVACASTGNTAASLAAYAARAGLNGRVYLPAGQVSRNKIAQALDFGAEVVQIEGNFDDALNTLLESGDRNLYFLNSINPFRIEGQKTAMFELLEQMNWNVPDYVVVPGGNLGNSSAFGKAFEELKRFGFIDRMPKLIVVQAVGANPFAQMWRSGCRQLEPINEPDTLATAIRIGNPRSWKKSLHAVESSGGFVIDVSDEEIEEAKAWIGKDGIGCEPASATTLAAIERLVRQGVIDRDATVVAVLTGHALKDTDYIIKSQQKRESNEEYAIHACC